MPPSERDSPSPRRPRGVLASLSLEYKLPLLIGGLLLTAILALATAAYVEMRQVTLRAAEARLQSITTLFRDALRESGNQLRAQAVVAAKRPALADYVKSGEAGNPGAALSALTTDVLQPEQVVASELRNASDSVLLSTKPAAGTDTIGAVAIAGELSNRDSAWLGALHVIHDTIVFAVVAPIPSSADVYLVRWRRVAGSQKARQDLMRLIGSDASVLVGNSDGSRWSDLVHPVPGPDAHARQALIPGTPWSVAVSFTRSQVLAPVKVFLWWMVGIAIAALLLGLGATWFASRRITTPLRRLTTHAREIARGDVSIIERIDRSDEISQLGEAFAIMATDVRESRQALESKVEERTRDLNQTLEQLRETQSALVRREKLAMLGQLAGGVGHELRNPLGVMTNAVYYLKLVLTEQPPKIHEYLEILQQQITLSEKIVSDLLDFARSKPPQRTPASLSEVTAAQLARLGSTNGVRVDAHLAPDGPSVLIDRVQVGQIILNLLTNALQAVEGTGTVTVRVGASDGLAHVEVADTGAGIPPENVERVFEPLFTTKARGIGLGLAVSRTLARANDGELIVSSSTPGAGATFRLSLPLREATAS